jgi:hypothetical protein
MSDSIRELPHERKIRFHGEAGFAKHGYRFRSRTDIRLAGKIWSESESDRSRRLARKRESEKMTATPVGVGFGEKDNVKPDNDYSSVEFLNKKLDQMSYKSQ